MNDLFEQRYQDLKQWAEETERKGWLGEEDVASLAEIERQQAEALFAQQGERPLVVAFFGGTGVGKSSLLNRLAGASVARVGVERPTSQEVTLYLHQDYQLSSLPTELPLDETRIAYHNDGKRRLLAWLDMPDFDSVEEHHRELVQAWLPYVDWVVYVVSPERYQDDIGWRFVQQRGGRHAWLFVMNHWDQGDEVQIEHLRQRLETEGFTEPLILRTSCRKPIVNDDEFPLLEQTLNRAIKAYGLELLQQIGVQARMQELQRSGTQLVDRVRDYPLQQLLEAWQKLVEEGTDRAGEELLVNSQIFSRTLAPEGVSPWYAISTKRSAQSVPQPGTMLETIWSGRVDTRIKDIANELVSRLAQTSVPVRPFQPLQEWVSGAVKSEFMDAAEGDCAEALLRPGTRLRRATMRMAGLLEWLLPVSAASWVAYHLVASFYQGTQGVGQFLGIDYAIHSLLLVLLAWFLPWLLKRKLQPGLDEASEAALKAGITSGVAQLRSSGELIFLEVIEQRDRCVAQFQLTDIALVGPQTVDPKELNSDSRLTPLESVRLEQ